MNKQQMNPALIRVWEVLQKNGELDGLSDNEVLEKVVSATEKVLNYLRELR